MLYNNLFWLKLKHAQLMEQFRMTNDKVSDFDLVHLFSTFFIYHYREEYLY